MLWTRISAPGRSIKPSNQTSRRWRLLATPNCLIRDSLQNKRLTANDNWTCCIRLQFGFQLSHLHRKDTAARKRRRHCWWARSLRGLMMEKSLN